MFESVPAQLARDIRALEAGQALAACWRHKRRLVRESRTSTAIEGARVVDG